MRKITIQKMGKIAAVSVMSAIISISFNGCGFLKSTGNKALASLGNTAQQGISSLGNTAEKGISNALSSESKSSSSKAKVANSENDKGKCSGNEIKTDTSIEKGECKGGKRNGVWKYYDNYGYIQKEITFQNGAMTLEKVYDKNENLENTISYDSKGKIVYKREYESGELKYFMHFNTYFERKYEVSNWKYRYESKIDEAKQQAQEIAKQRAESKVKKPTMQDVRKARETGEDAMAQYRAKLQAQEEKELQIELSKIPSTPNFDAYSDAQLIAYINSNQIDPSGETISNNGLKIIKYDYNNITSFYSGSSRVGELSGMSSCYDFTDDNDYAKYNCRTFAREFKELIDKSAFKEKIYNALPKPRNQ